jgi:Polysaccharide deacetylase
MLSEESVRMNRRSFLSMLSVLAASVSLSPAVWAAEKPLPRGMVTFTFDDGLVSNYNYALPIFKRRGQVATAGIVASRVASGNNDYMNVDQVREMEQGGWEIASHSLTHSRPVQIPKTYEQEPVVGWHADEKDPSVFQTQYEYERIAGLYQDGRPLKEVFSLAELAATPGSYWLDRCIAELHARPFRGGDPAELGIRAGSYQRELEESKRILVELGFNVDTYIAPHNYWTDDVEVISKRYYARACTGRDSDNRPGSFDPYAVKRFMAHTKDTPQSYMRIIKDHSLEHGGWVVFCFHGVGDNTGWEPYSAEGLDTVLGWVLEQGIPVVTIREGARIMAELKKNQNVPQTKSLVRKGS